MALREQFMVRTFENVNQAEIRADVGKSLLIKEIYVFPVVNDYLLVYIDKTTVGYFRIGGKGSHLAIFANDDLKPRNLLTRLYDLGIFKGYPIGEGQTLLLKTQNGNNVNITVVYEEYDAGDITPDKENGTEANEYFFINYGRPSNIPSGGGDVLIDTSIVPAEFPAFPFGADVPAKTEIDLIGIAFLPVGRVAGGGANKAVTKYIKLIKERVVLFDDDKNGITAFGTLPASDGVKYGQKLRIVGDSSNFDKQLPLIFKEPIKFTSGEELNVYITTEVIAGNNPLTPSDLEIAFLLKVRRVG